MKANPEINYPHVPTTTKKGLSYAEILIDRISGWIKRNSSPEFKKWKRVQLALTLYDDIYDNKIHDIEKEFKFDEILENQHALIMSFFYLNQLSDTLSQCEYYFRRFPFKNLPVSKADHLRNMCESYFSMFYTGRNRVKDVLNKLKEVCPNSGINFKAMLAQYDKLFDRELRTRNSITHHVPFDDRDIDKVMLTYLISLSGSSKDKGWDKEHILAYRKASKEWAGRAKCKGVLMRQFVDLVAKAIIEHAEFLSSECS